MKTSVSVVLALAAGAIAAPVAPGVPTAAAARSELAQLTVADQVDDGNYSRSQFKTWDIIHDKCNTRDVVLIRDGTDVQTNDRCTVGDGNWVSPYDGTAFTQGHDLDIDHMVPLKNAWVSGASAWTAKQRESFANDLTRPQLWAVSAHANRSKGDKGPEEYLPPSADFKCSYAESWVQVKSYYKLTVTQDEKNALAGVLANC